MGITIPIHSPIQPEIQGFGELSVTAPLVPLKPGSPGSAGLWAIAGTPAEVATLKAAGPKQTAAIVAFGGAEVSAIAAEIDLGNKTGSVATLLAQGAQTGLSAQTDSGTAVLGVSGTGGIAIVGRSIGGLAAQFVGNVENNGQLVINGPLTAEDTTINGNLAVTGTLTVNAVPIVDQSAQVAALQNAVQNLEGLQQSFNALENQVQDLQNQLDILSGQIAAKG